jgi:DNA-binding transcriptional LysR family regulator
MELGGTEAIKRAVESGMGISCLPTVALTGAVERGNLVAIATPFLRLTRVLHILLHKQKYRTEGITSLLRMCQAPVQPDIPATS